MGDVGPFGPCSEILIDRGPTFGATDVQNGERFFEIWNLVFMQFNQKPDGTKEPLPRPSIDTGMGLERMAMVLQGRDSVFATDAFARLIGAVEELTGTAYDPGPAGVPHRVLADHIRSLVFAFADGAEPSNEGRGYVLRRILRRAARYARKIHTGGPLLHRLVDVVVEDMGGAYPEIRERSAFIRELIKGEEERFGETLDKGIALFEEVTTRLRSQGSTTIPGEEVFKLYDTFGFPADLVEKMAAEIGFGTDAAGFERLMAEQKERSRGASQFHVVAGGADELNVERFPETDFQGYSRTRAPSEVLGVEAREGLLRVVLAATPFYAESGGQVGDTGSIRGPDFVLQVEDTRKEKGRYLHYCRLASGDPVKVQSGAVVDLLVDAERRIAIERNHTATHLLHAALRGEVGTHVHQKGSLVEAARLRFDVTHFKAFGEEEVRRVEDRVRTEILKNARVETFETDYEDAVRRGAMALFGEKYGDRVRVVKIGDFSLELCGGTHVQRTGDLGPFLIAGEGSVSAGVRRLEAVTAAGAETLQRRAQETLKDLSRLLKAPADSLVARVQKLIEENRDLKARRKADPGGAPTGGGDGVRRERLGKVLFVSGVHPEGDGKALREAYDRVKREAEEVVAVLCTRPGGKVQILVGVSPALVERGWDAREILAAGAASLGARGGGRPELVQAGGAGGPEAVEEALRAMLHFVERKSSPAGG
jgi:alanyl-tRNA synthetase